MTQEEIKEFWRTQTIIQMKDIVNVQGKAYVKSSSVERISKEYDLPSFPKGQFIPLVEFGPLVMKAYKKKQDRRDFAMDHKEEIKTVVKYFKTKVSSLSEDKRTNSSFVASYLVLQFAFNILS